MQQVPPRGSYYRFAALAVLFELSLALIATVLGSLTGPWPWQTLASATGTSWWAGWAWGTATAVALFVAVVVLDRHPVGIVRELQQTVRSLVVPLFRGTGLTGLAVISLAAGVGEELLFRGYCQAVLAHWWSPPWGAWSALLAASLLFGMCHWISPAYAVFATLMGLVLGGLFLATGHLIAPIVAHALYDFLALVHLCYERPEAGGWRGAQKNGGSRTWHEPP